MLKRFAVLVALIGLVGCLLSALASAQSAPPSSIIMKLVAGLTDQAQVDVIASNGGILRSSIPALRLYVIGVPAAELADTLARYQADPRVERAEENKVRVSESVPGDPLYPDQWALPRIGWDQVFGTVTSTGIAKVAILDTGVDALHPELAGVVVAGTSILDGSNGMTDPSGHGTWLAGIIAARTGGASPDGIAGVAYDGVRIMPVTVLNANGEGLDSDVIAGVIWAVDHGAHVILMAFSNPGFSPALQEAIDYAWSRGVVLVASAGNSASSTPAFPAGDRGVMGVAATDQNDAQAAFSNEGQAVFIAAPGTDIPTTSFGDAYAVIGGTSAAAAHVAGLAAFMKAVDPTLSNGVIVFRIASTADPAGTQIETGNGRINMARALASTATDFIQPAGADPLAEGGPFVGPYRADANQTVSGTVRDASTNAPIAGATLSCPPANGCNGPNTTTSAANGTYSLTLQFPGNNATISITASKSGYVTQTSAPFAITSSTPVTGKNFALVPVANTPPTIARSNALVTVNEGTTAANSGTWSDANAGDTVTLTASVGTVNKLGTNAAGTWSWSFLTTDGPAQSQTVTITANDGNGGTATTTFSLTVSNMPPTAAITGAPATSPEGTAINLGSTVTDPSSVDTAFGITMAWSVTKNGSPFASGSGASLSFTPNDNGSYVVTLSATDKDGGVGNDSKTITVTNVPPTATITGAAVSSAEGTTITLGSTVTDPSSADTAAGFTFAWSVTKNGSPFASGTASNLSFTPDDNGTYLVSLSVTDKDGGVGSDSKTITVTNVPPTASITGAPATSPEGTAINLGSTVTDPSAQDTATGFTVAWSVTKNGSPFASGNLASFSFTPDDNGTYEVSLSAMDKDGGVGNDSKTVTVNNVPPTATITGAPASSPEGTAISLGSTVTDPSAQDTAAGFTRSWSVTKNGAPFGSTGSGTTFSFTPDDNGTYVVSLSATDKDGGVGNDSKTVTVNNVPPTATFSNNGPVAEGGSATISFSNQLDPSSADTTAGFRYAFSCTNGDLSGATYAGSGTSATTPCPFDDGPATKIVKARIIDKDGGFTEYTTTVTVNNVPPTITAVTPSPTSVLVGETVTFTGTATDPSSADTAAGLQWSWNGGVTFGAPNANTFPTSYGVCGSYTVAALAKDKDGGVSTSFTSTAVTVWNGNFLEPLREGTSNLVQKGRVVPVKISFGCGGHRSGLAPAIQLLNGDFVSSAGTESESNFIDTLSVSNADTTGVMREVDSKYMYNLAIPNNSTWSAGKPLTIRVSPFGNGTAPVMYILLEIRK